MQMCMGTTVTDPPVRLVDRRRRAGVRWQLASRACGTEPPGTGSARRPATAANASATPPPEPARPLPKSSACCRTPGRAPRHPQRRRRDRRGPAPVEARHSRSRSASASACSLQRPPPARARAKPGARIEALPSELSWTQPWTHQLSTEPTIASEASPRLAVTVDNNDIKLTVATVPSASSVNITYTQGSLTSEVGDPIGSFSIQAVGRHHRADRVGSHGQPRRNRSNLGVQ